MSAYAEIQKNWRKYEVLTMMIEDNKIALNGFESLCQPAMPTVIESGEHMERYLASEISYRERRDMFQSHINSLREQANKAIARIKYLVPSELYGTPIQVDAHLLTVKRSRGGDNLFITAKHEDDVVETTIA